MPDKIKVKLTNRIALLTSGYDYDKLIRHWSFSVPNYKYVLRSKPFFRKCQVCGKYPNSKKNKSRHDDRDHDYVPIWDGKIKILKRDRLPSGLFHATKDELQKKERIVFIEDKSRLKVPKGFPSSKWLKSTDEYSFQNDCVDKMQGATAQGGGLILNATGSGKTRIAAMYASRFDCEILFVVDQLNLLDQARADIGKHLGEKIGKVGESEFKLRRVTVATRQTLSLHLNSRKFKRWFERVDVIFVDEIHEQMNKSNFEVIAEAKPLAVFGLTATLGLSRKPVRLKAYSLCGPVLFTYPVKQGMADNVLSNGIVIRLLYNSDIRETNAYKSSEEAYKERIVSNDERNELVERIVRRARHLGKYTFVLVERLKHLSRLSRSLDDIPHRIMAGTFRGEKIKRYDRLLHQKQFEKGKVRVVLGNKVVKKGIDIRRLDVAIDAAGRKSKEDAVQKFGRGLRKHADKSGFIYIDISDIDKYDKHRDEDEKKNWFAAAARRRARALKAAGITIKTFVWEVDGEEKELFKFAERLLEKEISHGRS